MAVFNRRRYLAGMGAGLALLTGGCLSGNNGSGNNGSEDENDGDNSSEDGDDEADMMLIWVQNKTSKILEIAITLSSQDGGKVYENVFEIETKSAETTEIERQTGKYTVEAVYDGDKDREEITIREDGNIEVSIGEDSTRIEFVNEVPLDG
jgi:hypothetical protein